MSIDRTYFFLLTFLLSLFTFSERHGFCKYFILILLWTAFDGFQFSILFVYIKYDLIFVSKAQIPRKKILFQEYLRPYMAKVKMRRISINQFVHCLSQSLLHICSKHVSLLQICNIFFEPA